MDVKLRGVGVLMGLWGLACAGEATPEPVAPPPAEAPPAPPPKPSTTAGATRCPPGVHFVETWQGEYPGPAVDVKSPVPLPAREDPCAVDATFTCNVPVGLYHPWSDKPAKFGTIRPLQDFKALRATSISFGEKAVPIAAGDVVTITAYASEGFCEVKVGDVTDVTECPDLLSDEKGPFFEQTSGKDIPEIEVLGVTCDGGKQLWIDATDELFTHPEVKQGSITEYGHVDHAE